jgi:hypothetical protein
MSGKRQHFIPRFLQEGFASHRNGDEAFTWVYRKGKSAFNTNIINVGIEGLFYTEAQDTEVDDAITDAENAFSNLVQELRIGRCDTACHPQIATLLAHLEIRTRHLRQSFLSLGQFAFERLLDAMLESDYFLRKFIADPSLIKESFAEEWDRRQLPPDLLEPFWKSVVLPTLPDFIRQQARTFPKFAESIRIQLPDLLKRAAKSGHIRALKSEIAPQWKVRRYGELTYAVRPVSDKPLILGDSPVVFQVDGKTPYKPFLGRDDILIAVLLPLSPTVVLIGAPVDAGTVPSGLAQVSARCSLEYFISNERSPTNDALQQQIGNDADLLSRAELEEILAEVIDGKE